MPSRLIREGILSSDRVDLLDPPSEVFYRRLMSKVDDHGLYDARPSILRTSLYPLRVDRVREADCSRWIAACEKAGLIALYEHDGKPYLQMLDTRWVARSTPKYPLPSDPGCALLQTPENRCEQLIAPVALFGDVVVVEVDNSSSPDGAGGRDGYFDEFWNAYPKKVGKDAAKKAFAKRKPTRELLTSMLTAIALQRQTKKWNEEAGQFIPHPTTWLNEGRWQDEVASDGGPAVAADTESRAAIEAEGVSKGIGKWDQIVEQWPAYKARVRAKAPGWQRETA